METAAGRCSGNLLSCIGNVEESCSYPVDVEVTWEGPWPAGKAFCSEDFCYAYAENKQVTFVPICMAMQDFETSSEVGKIIADTIKNTSGNIAIIASTDFSHAGFNYMSMPPEGTRVDEYAEKQDKLAIEQILKMSPQGLINTVNKNNISMCGYGPVAAMLTATKILGANKAELLKYGTSYEVHPNSSCVGYAAINVY